MNKNSLFIMVSMLTVLLTTSCDENDPDPVIPNEEEVITTLKFTLTPADGGSQVVLSFQDLDGVGGDDPVITDGILKANTTYTGTLELLNELEDPVEDITEEIEKEALDHQFFFNTSIAGVSIAYDDTDSNGHPIGLSTIVTTASEGTGTISIILRHEPAKDASGVSAGDISNAGGETDIEVAFDVVVV